MFLGKSKNGTGNGIRLRLLFLDIVGNAYDAIGCVVALVP